MQEAATSLLANGQTEKEGEGDDFCRGKRTIGTDLRSPSSHPLMRYLSLLARVLAVEHAAALCGTDSIGLHAEAAFEGRN